MYLNFEMMGFAILKKIKTRNFVFMLQCMYFNFVDLDFSERAHFLETPFRTLNSKFLTTISDQIYY